MFYSWRDPYGPNPGSCLGTIVVSLIIVALLTFFCIYFGSIILIIFLIIGGILGLGCAVYACAKAIPQTVNDVKNTYFQGNKIIQFLKKLGYVFICIAKYSLANIFDLAKLSIAKFKSYKLLSFKKWMYFALLIGVVVFGLILLVSLIAVTVLAVFGIVFLLFQVTFVVVSVFAVIGVLTNFVISEMNFIKLSKNANLFSCFRFNRSCTFKNVLSIPKEFFALMKDWIKDGWLADIAFTNGLRNKYSAYNVFSVQNILAFAFWIIMPISACVSIAVTFVLTCLCFLPAYIVNIIWIVINAVISLF